MIDFFARHPTAGNLLMLFLAVLGFMALPELQRETFPEFDAEVVEVRVLYPGASAEDVEEAICQRIEDAIDGINDVNELTCDAREGVAIANVEMTEGGEIAVFMDDVKSEIDAINNFPENTEQPTVKELGRTSQVVTIAITGPMSVSDLKAFAEQTKDRLQQVPEISQVTVAGFSDHQLRIDVPERKLRQFGLSMSDIANTVARQGIDLPAGALETRNRDILLRFTDLRRTPTELEELIVVGAASGAEIRLGDIATITDRFELDEEKTLFN
ncbi:MAG: efflux RND transporter permease subunit, partial [Chromatiales bacterium]|nr:efflux RND transporter permease subunit [Chromatiales bacterium]